MSVLDFPTSPTNGQYYNGFVWNSTNETWDSAYSPLAPVGGLRQTIYYTSSGTFEKASYPWLRAIRVRVQGAGGGGGAAAATGASQASAGDNGAGGGYAESFITDIEGLAGTVTVTVGAGGAGGVSGVSNGATGGTSSFGAAVSATGGGGGTNRGALAYGFVMYLIGASGGGTGTGDFTVRGGETAIVANNSGSGFAVQTGPGSSYLSPQRGQISTTTKLTQAGSLYGGGAYGGLNDASETATNGGAGAAGIVIVDLFS